MSYVPNDVMSILIVMRSWNLTIFLNIRDSNLLACTKIALDIAVCLHVLGRHPISGCHSANGFLVFSI
jgi:hypothetical protein